MEIQAAITTAKEMMEMGKKHLQIQVEKSGEIKAERYNPLPDSKGESFKKMREKANEFIKDKENVEGIKFLEENGEHFTLERRWKHAFYLCSNGSFKQQRWGMYMGNKDYITSAKSYDFSKDETEMISSLNFKGLLVKQILEIGKNKRVKPEDAFKEMFISNVIICY